MTTIDSESDLRDDEGDGEPIDDSLLLEAARAGSLGAYGILYARHRQAALRTARRTLGHADRSLAEDVVELAFLRVFTALRNGKGPRSELARYLATSVKREAWRAHRRRRSHDALVDRYAAGEAALAAPASGELALGEGHHLLGEAFRSLSARWRNVLWLTEVEGRTPAEVGGLLGVSAASASSLAYRARQGLVAAYLATYQRIGVDAACSEVAPDLLAYLGAGRPSDGFDGVVAHLESCRTCRDVVRGVDVLGPRLAAVVPVALLSGGWWAASGGSPLAGAAAGSTAAAPGGGATGTGAPAAVGVASSTSFGAAAVAAGVAASVLLVVGGIALTDAASSPGGADGAIEAAAVGEVRADASPPSPAPPTREVLPEGSVPAPTSAIGDGLEPSTAPPPVEPPQPEESATGRRPSVPSPDPMRPVDVAPSASAVPPSATTVPTTTPAVPTTTAPATSAVPTSTVPAATAVPTTTTPPTTVPPVGSWRLGGRVVWLPLGLELLTWGVEDVPIDLLDGDGRVVETVSTDARGFWSTGLLPAGSYRAIARVPASHVPLGADAGWADGGSWDAELGTVTLSGRDVDLPDLRLAPRWVVGPG